MSNNSEIPKFFDSGSRRLFGVFHRPDTPQAHTGWVLVHPFGEEKLWSHRVFVNLARAAAADGIPVLRFDLSGQGDSGSETLDCSIDDYLEDVDSAVRQLKEESPGLTNTNLLGLRFGATLAMLYAQEHRFDGKMILWEPILDGSKYMQELLRINLSTQLAVFGKVQEDRNQLVGKLREGTPANVDGYLLSPRFFEQCESIDLTGSEFHSLAQDIIVTQIAPTPTQKEREPLVSLANSLARGRFHKSVQPPFWREIKPFISKAENVINDALEFMTELPND